MLTLLLTLIVWLVILGLIWWAVHRLAGIFGIPPQIVGVIDVVLVVIVVIALLYLLIGQVPAISRSLPR